MKHKIIIPLVLLILACGEENEIQNINSIANEYVILALELGKHNTDYIDAYFGPEEIKKQVDEGEKLTLNEIQIKSNNLLESLQKMDLSSFDEPGKLRYENLKSLIKALHNYSFILRNGNESVPFDKEAELLYHVKPPGFNTNYFDNILTELDKILLGDTTLQARYNTFVQQFVIPGDKLDEVFSAAIEKSQLITLDYFELPENESFSVEYVKDKPWGAYNWFQGGYKSIIEVNTDLPITIDRAIDLACHEGYPGHHVFHTLVEKNMLEENGWLEYSVYPLFSPMSLISEGTANFGIEVVFPGEDKILFAKEVLFPVAGLDTSGAEHFFKVLELKEKLGFASIEAARMLEVMPEEDVVSYLMKYQLRTEESAKKHIEFIKKYGAYIINYSMGEKLVEEYIIRHGGTKDEPAKRWMLFADLLNNPIPPSFLEK